MINKVDAICLLVKNLSQSRAFYEGVLGLKVNLTDEGFIEYKTLGAPLAIFERKFATAMFPTEYMSNPGGAVIALHVDDVNSECNKLNKMGVEIFEGPKTTPWNQVVAYLHDPDGYIIELTNYITN